MEVNLEIPDDYTALSRAIFNLFKATLEYPANPQTKSSKLADDIVFCCASAVDSYLPFWEIWPVFIRLAACIPPGHDWQESLIQSLHILCRRDGSVSSKYETALWKELPDFSMNVVEYLQSAENPSNLAEFEDEVGAKWKNFHSFLARFSTPGFAPSIASVVWQLQEAFEEPIEPGPLTDCKVWVATEWIVHSADRILAEMKDETDVENNQATDGIPGKLCSDIPAQSIQRWEFWKKRITEISSDLNSLELETATAAKLTEALEAMDDAEKSVA